MKPKSRRTNTFQIVDQIARRPETNTRIVTFRPTANPETWRHYVNPSRASLRRLWAVMGPYGFEIDQAASIMATTETTLKTGNPWTAFVYA